MNTVTIGEQIYRGMGAAGWLLGFLILFAGALIAFILIGYGIMLIAKAGDDAGKRKEVNRRGGAQTYGYRPSGNAQTMGRHMRKGL